MIYTDNRSTFQGTADWMNKVQKEERFPSYLIQHDITWKFNLSRAPWWGVRFERIIGAFKSAFRKAVENGISSWSELADVVLDVKVAINEPPSLSYVEEDAE